MENKRVLQVIDTMGFGGAEKVVLTLSEEFLNHKCSVDVIMISGKEVFSLNKSVTKHNLGFRKSCCAYSKYSRKLHKMVKDLELKNGKFDLILVHLQQSIRLMNGFKSENMYCCLHSRLSESSLSNRKGLRLWMKKKRLQNIYNGLNLISVSEGVLDDVVNNVHIKPKSIQTIYNPINFESIEALSEQDEKKCNDQKFIIHVGRFSPVKRHDLLIKAYKMSNINAKLILVGDGPLRNKIEKLINEENLSDRVILMGYMQNPYNCILKANLLVLSSDYEGFGNVLVESLLLGTPVISTDCPSGPRSILKGELQKNLVPVGDVEALAEAIKFFFKEKVNDKKRFLPNIEEFNSIHIVEEYLRLAFSSRY